ncbi:MAG: mercuric resistance transcriptional repressor MerD [Steroidobacteraceae bacterium]
MSAYTVSRLAEDAGVSVSVVRDYVLRGLLRPSGRTAGGISIYDAHALARLRFVRAMLEAGISLAELRDLCHALDGRTHDAGEFLAGLRAHVAARAAALAVLGQQLEAMESALRSGTKKPSPGG